MSDKLAALREGIAANLSVIPGMQSNGYWLSSPTPPCAEVYPAGVEYHRAMGNGHSDWTFTVRVFVAAQSDIGAQMQAGKYLGESGDDSVKAALEDDPTLGGEADDLIVRSVSSELSVTRPDGGTFIGYDWTVDVMAEDR